tara:strand:- start:1741 stop:2451 length:711 start_codon:yes stop_codon:yes gene_type:complete
MHLPGKLNQTKKCLDALFTIERNWKFVDSFVLINEYDPNNPSGIDLSWIKKEFPLFQIIQKGREEMGQAYSINIIIDILKSSNMTYWLHWEESWMLQQPFLLDALSVMQTCPSISQLQIAKGWDDVPHDTHNGYFVISKEYHSIVDNALGSKPIHFKWKFKPWPLFSLQPGIDRIQNIINIGYFVPNHNTVPRGKVNGSEFNFSHRWYLQHVKKGVLTPFRTLRDVSHYSTSIFIK